MMAIYLTVSLIIFGSGVTGYVMKRKHFLVMLLSLELIIVSIYLSMFLMLSMLGLEHFISMLYITMGVCESVLGLALLVSMVRVHGNDYTMTFSSLW